MILLVLISSLNSLHFTSLINLQLSPGRDGSDPDMEPSASQSQDCEPTPPLQRHGSKSNFFLPQADCGDSPPSRQHAAARVALQQQYHPPSRCSPHPQPREGARGGTPEGGLGQRPSPTMQQRMKIKALGVPTPLAMSSPVRRWVDLVVGRLFWAFWGVGGFKAWTTRCCLQFA